MIEYDKFKTVIGKAEKIFGHLDEERRKIYWQNVRGFSEETVSGAVDRIISTHGFYKFPTVAELLDAVSDHSGLVESHPWTPACPDCGGVGRTVAEYWVGDETYYKEQFCPCEEGQRQHRIRAEYMEKRRRGLTRADGSVIRKEKSDG